MLNGPVRAVPASGGRLPPTEPAGETTGPYGEMVFPPQKSGGFFAAAPLLTVQPAWAAFPSSGVTTTRMSAPMPESFRTMSSYPRSMCWIWPMTVEP